jgi:salicylate hydroxylase
LHSLVTKASAASVVAYQAFQAFEDDEDWILPSVPGVLLGDAAHPAIPASIQACPAALEDAAVFAKLFSHLRRREQIPSFLSAFTSLRAERVRRMQEADAQLFQYSLMPYDDSGLAQIRDDSFRALTKAGRMVLGQADGDAASNAQWYGTLMTWVYGQFHVSGVRVSARIWRNTVVDAEDDADDWWMKWGVIEERGRENPQALDFDLAASITDVSASTKITTKNSSTGSSKAS